MRRINIIVSVLLKSAAVVLFLVWLPVALMAAANGTVSGTLKDPSGAVVADATITLVNTAIKSEYKALSNGQGFYSFPTLPVGHYDLTIEASGFKTQTRRNLSIDTDAALQVDASLALAQRVDTVTVEPPERPPRLRSIPWQLIWATW